jgi:hypothetical protein
MHNHLFTALLGVSFVAVGPLRGQAEGRQPEAEIFAGGSKVWTSASGTHFDTHGWGGSITGNFNRYVGAEMEIFKYSDYPQDPPEYGTNYTFLFGPHVACRRARRVTPFGHVLVGGMHGRQNILPPYPPGVIPNTASALTGRTAFTVGLGGGLDVKVWRSVSLRVLQTDYLRAPFPNDVQNSLRLSFGVVFHLGHL